MGTVASIPDGYAPRIWAFWAALCAGSTALLLWLSHFPFNLAPLAWVALIPYLALVRMELPTWQRYFFAWLSGYLFLLPALSWMRVAHAAMVYSWLALSFYCSWYYLLAMFLLRWLDRRTSMPFIVTVPLVWVAIEYAQGNLMGGFPWYFLSHSQHNFLPLIQVSDLGGAWLVSMLVAMANGALADWLLPRFGIGSCRPVARQFVAASIFLGGALLYGFARLQADLPPGPRVALLQTDLPQGDRLAAENPDPVIAAKGALSIEAQTFALSRRVREAKERPDLVIWPETTFEMDDVELDPGAVLHPDLVMYRQRAQSLMARRAEYVNCHVLFGINTVIVDSQNQRRRCNSATLLGRDGSRLDRYDKVHLVPFGEYVPFRDQWPWLQSLTPYEEGMVSMLAPGSRLVRFRFPAADGREYSFGVVICYEDSFGELTREYVRPSNEPPVDFLVNITNDGWFYLTAEHEQHLAVSRFRAVECRRSLVRAVNSGISAVIDSCGRIVALPRETPAQSRCVLEAVISSVPLDRRQSVYAVAGDWLPLGSWALIGLYGFAIRRKPNDR